MVFIRALLLSTFFILTAACTHVTGNNESAFNKVDVNISRFKNLASNITVKKKETKKKSIKKIHNVKKEVVANTTKVLKTENKVKVLKLKKVNATEINDKEEFKRKTYKVKTSVKLISFASSFKGISIQDNSRKIAANSKKEALKKKRKAIEKKAGPIGPDNFVNDEDNITDLIKVAQAAVEKNVQEPKVEEPKIGKDEIFAIDLRKDEEIEEAEAKSNIQKLAMSSQISDSVKEVIKRELIKKKEKSPTQSKSPNQKAIEKLFEKPVPTQIESRKVIKAFGVSLGDKTEVEEIFAYDFAYSFDSQKIVNDEDGKIILDTQGVRKKGLVRGELFKLGYLKTIVEFPVNSDVEIIPPLFEQTSFYNFLDKNSINGPGGHVIFELDEVIRDVEIESDYYAKVFLNEDLKIVEDLTSAVYIMFVSTPSGTQDVTLLYGNEKEVVSTIHIEESKVLYKILSVDQTENLRVSLYEDKLMNKKKKELVIDEEDVGLLGSKKTSLKLDINTHEIKMNEYVFGDRAFLKLTHLNDDLIIAPNGSKEIFIPSKDFVGEVLYQVNLDRLENGCAVQLNYSEPIENLEFALISSQGNPNYELVHLDSFGEYQGEHTEFTKKSFIFGDLEGIVNIKVSYLNGGSEYIQTFCQSSKYLVEQL